MIVPEQLYNFLKEQGISFYTGVPDSLLKHFLKFIQDTSKESEHIITANEGLAIGLAAGYHFRTGKIPLVYLQNSGLGNIINPLTSLADKEVYSVPMLIMIGWRGKPGTKDEPQHIKMGRVTIAVLEALEVPCFILDEEEDLSFKKITKAIEIATAEKKPVALLIPEEILGQYNGVINSDHYSLIRENVISQLISRLNGEEIVVCTTGKSGREFYEQNLVAGNKIQKYFLSVGAMGHANHIALGLKNGTDDKIVVIDGDGALLMHMGALPSIAHYATNNFIHVVINNGSHESVGGQPTEGFFANCCGIAKASGYANTFLITNSDELENWLTNALPLSTTQFVEIRTNRQSRADLGRPAGYPVNWKNDFMKALNNKDPN